MDRKIALAVPLVCICLKIFSTDKAPSQPVESCYEERITLDTCYYLLDTMAVSYVSTYVEKYYIQAQQLQTTFGQPASVKLAQGLLESGIGSSYLARSANNHFGIKCWFKNCPSGHCITKADDRPDDRFRVYDSADISYLEHSQFLRKPNYQTCKGGSWLDWCYCLKENGYATDPDYSKKLIQIIKKYKLYQFDL